MCGAEEALEVRTGPWKQHDGEDQRDSKQGEVDDVLLTPAQLLLCRLHLLLVAERHAEKTGQLVN
jgi:hypothetical protein